MGGIYFYLSVVKETVSVVLLHVHRVASFPGPDFSGGPGDEAIPRGHALGCYYSVDWTTGLDYWTHGNCLWLEMNTNIPIFDSALQERRGYLASLPGLLHIVSRARLSARESLARETIL